MLLLQCLKKVECLLHAEKKLPIINKNELRTYCYIERAVITHSLVPNPKILG